MSWYSDSDSAFILYNTSISNFFCVSIACVYYLQTVLIVYDFACIYIVL